ncbi:hypothetical protein RhiirA4_400121, partial [Rhizophagus irregularis]
IQSSCLHTQIHELATLPSTSSLSCVYSSQPEEIMLTGSLNIKQDAAPSTSSPSRVYSSKPEETMLTGSLNIKQDAAIWK